MNTNIHHHWIQTGAQKDIKYTNGYIAHLRSDLNLDFNDKIINIKFLKIDLNYLKCFFLDTLKKNSGSEDALSLDKIQVKIQKIFELLGKKIVISLLLIFSL